MEREYRIGVERMIDYRKGSDIESMEIYSAFSLGFSDYMIKFDMEAPAFFERFFGAEGNQYELSYVAFDGEQAIGVLLGGIKVLNGYKTLRCGALAVAPEYRGKGVSKELMRLHQQAAKNEKCDLMMLEVIAGNDRAIQFYKRENYKPVYDIRYFTCKGMEFKRKTKDQKSEINPVSIKSLELIELKQRGAHKLKEHFNWQGDFEYISQLESIQLYGAFDSQETLIGYTAVDKMGKIYFIWRDKVLSEPHVYESLVAHVIQSQMPESIHMSFSNDLELSIFVEEHGFKALSLYQHEMYKVIF